LASSFAANVPSLYSSRQRWKGRKGGRNIGSSDISPVRRVRELNDLESTIQQSATVHELNEIVGKETAARSNDTGSMSVHV
jgi:hypothetical protein